MMNNETNNEIFLKRFMFVLFKKVRDNWKNEFVIVFKI
jgi:hypothetical protein